MKEVKSKPLGAVALAALGIVYGDIGTSPLYAFEQVFSNGVHSVPISHNNVLGVLSLFLWSLIMVVTVKYVNFIMKADNDGEGGIIALMALALGKLKESSISKRILFALGLLGAAFFYGDGVITPAISVLSAVEGLELISPTLKDYVVPVSIAILLLLFWYQRKGTGSIGLLFGPLMAIWFIVIGVLGFYNLLSDLSILKAISPIYAISFVLDHGILSFFSLGAVVLCLTGAEALYADMGHFGKRPIRIVWYSLVLPSLVLNYFGQGALLLKSPEALNNLFYLTAPNFLQTPLIILATIATVIASQAVISGIFSMTRQAIQLGFIPRVKILQTSASEVGQIYLPMVNFMLAIGVIAVILIFKSSNALGSAYGIAVTGTMLITDFLAIAVATKLWGWSKLRAILGALVFIIIDFVFFSSNALKFLDGGWLPISISIFMLVIMTTWFRGREVLIRELKEEALSLTSFLDKISNENITRINGTAFYLATDNTFAPISLVRTYQHFCVIHSQVCVISIIHAMTPFVKDSERLEIVDKGQGFYQISLKTGFMEKISIPDKLRSLLPKYIIDNIEPVSFLVNKQVIVVSNKKGLAKWRKHLYRYLYRNSETPMEFFGLPEDDSLAVSIKIEI